MDLPTRLAKLHQRIAKQDLPGAMADFLGVLMSTRTAAHELHLQQTGPGSFARHAALGELYALIGGLVDDLAEVYQGDYGVITFYHERFSLAGSDPVGFVTAVRDYIDGARGALPQASHLQNIVDEIRALVARTRYKLVNLA